MDVSLSDGGDYTSTPGGGIKALDYFGRIPEDRGRPRADHRAPGGHAHDRTPQPPRPSGSSTRPGRSTGSSTCSSSRP
ncbi:MAG: hypothetical protein M0C28_15600 [Candidatus Moduliflexus flocculans]|nr:hypothetical protein [Candidatus Moduliflexus flocculans]